MAREPERFDWIVIGTGQGGKPLASALARAGRRTAIVERGAVGGSCVNHGCTPTKTMVASARVAYLARRAGDFGVRAGEVAVDMERVRARKRAIVESFRSGGEQGLEGAEGLELVRGEASFAGPRTVRVRADGGERLLAAEHVVIDTGLVPVRPPIEGLDEVGPLDNASIMELGEVPRHLLVLGAGYVGLEFAQMFRRFGSEVTVVDRGRQVLSREDEDVAAELAGILREDGIELVLESSAARAARSGSEVRLELDGGRTLAGSHLLLAAGRAPATEALELDAAGVETDERGFVRVDSRLRTTAEGVYAIGDVKGGPAFTHVSYDDFRVLERIHLAGEDASIEGRLDVYAVYTDPELGRVGATEREARERGRDVRVAVLPMSKVARALEMDETRGLVKAVVDAETERILGASVLGVHGGELMATIQVAMTAGLSYTALRDGMFAHPLFAEALNNLFASFE